MLWDPCLDLAVLRAEARAATRGEANIFDASRWASNAMLVAGGPGDEHLLLHDGQHHQIRLHIITGTLLEGPVALRFDFALADRFEPALAMLRRFLHLCRSGEWLPGRPLPDRMRRRILLALRVHDALTHGASIRDIGIVLFGKARVDAEWRDPGESLKSQCRRLIALARTMARGGYKDLLR